MGSACMGRMRESVSSVKPIEVERSQSQQDEYDNFQDNKIVERFFTKALCSGDIKTSLLCIMMSPGCKEAFYAFLQKSLDTSAFLQYIQNLNVFMDTYKRTNGNCRLATGCEWTHQHAEMVTRFINDCSFKTWRAVESANVLSAMAECSIEEEENKARHFSLKKICSFGTPRTVDEDETTVPSQTSMDSLHCSRTCSNNNDGVPLSSVSLDVLHSVKIGCTESIATGSVWMVQYLSMMEDFPIPFTLAKATDNNSIVYANKSFEKFSGCSRSDVVNNASTCMGDVFTAPEASEVADIELCGEYSPFWSTGFNGAYAPVSIQTSYAFKSTSKSSPLANQGQCVLAMKPIYNQFGELCYIASFYEPILARSALNLAIIANARQRNIKFLNSLPSIVCSEQKQQQH